MPPTDALRRETVSFQPVWVRTGSHDTVGRLAFADDELVAVLVRLDDHAHDAEQRGGWFLEVGFGSVAAVLPPVFDDLDAAASWIGQTLGPPRPDMPSPP